MWSWRGGRSRIGWVGGMRVKLYHPSRYAADRHRNKSIVIPAQAGIQGFGWWANAPIENTD